MSHFAVVVKKIKIIPHPNADKIEIGLIDDYQCIVGKNQFMNEQLVAYIPEQAIIPQNILKEMNLEGKLAGKNKNRLKPITLRGILSQGLVYPAKPEWQEGDDVTELLGVTKWEPEIPARLAGERFFAGFDKTIKYDIENIKKFPRVIKPGEEVVFSEKIHGTFTLFGYMPEVLAHPTEGRLIVSSKGLSAQGFALKINSVANKENLYLRVARHLYIGNRIESVFNEEINDKHNPSPVFIIGEIFGSSVQDLGYGAKIDADHKIGFRIFDIYIGKYPMGRYLNDEELDVACERLEIPRVPVLYRGPFWHSKVAEYTDGKETVSGENVHIREGIVIRPRVERKEISVGRVQLKSVSAAYLCRKGNITEYQ